MLRTVQATRYVLPLRECGSLPLTPNVLAAIVGLVPEEWLSAVPDAIQPSPVHTGVCDATDDLLDRLEKQFLAP